MKTIIFLFCLVWATTAFATDYNQYNKVDKVIVQEKIVEFDKDIFNPQAYVAVPQNLQEKDLAELKSKDIQISKLIELILKLLEALTGTEVDDGSVNPQQPSLEDKVHNWLREDCKACHSSGSASGNYTLFENGQLIKLSLGDYIKIHDVVRGVNLADRGKKQMPLNGNAWSDERVEALYTLIQEKAQ